MSRLKRILSGLICVCILASAFSAFAQTQTDSVLTQVVFEGKAYENRTDFTWELHNPIPEGGVKWDGDAEQVVVKKPESDDIGLTPDGKRYIKGELMFVAKQGRNVGDEFAAVEQLMADYGLRIVGYIAIGCAYQVETVEVTGYDNLLALAKQLNQESLIEPGTVIIEIITKIEDSLLVTPTEDYNSDTNNALLWNGDPLDENNPSGTNWGIEYIKAPSAWKYDDITNRIRCSVVEATGCGAHDDLSYSVNVSEPDSHGTHVAGIIAAKHDDIGVSGVFHNAELVGITAGEKYDDYQGSVIFPFALCASLGMAIGTENYESKLKIIINISINIAWREYSEEERVKADIYNFSNGIITNGNRWLVDQARNLSIVLQNYLNVGFDFVICQAAGNDYAAVKINTISTYAPICITEPNIRNRIIVVGAMGITKAGLLGFYDASNPGNRVDLLAPGVDIYSTTSPCNRYGYKSGTSMAAPHVAGAAAFVWSIDPSFSGNEVTKIVIGSCLKYLSREEGYDIYRSADRPYPILNVLSAVEEAREKAAKATVSGIVECWDTYPGKYVALPDATVSLFENRKKIASVQSDQNGWYAFTVKPGIYTLEAQKDGYYANNNNSEELSVKSREKINQNLYLHIYNPVVPTPTPIATPTPTPVANELKCYRTDSMDPVYAGNIIRLELRNAKNGVVKFDVTIVNNGIYHVNTEWGLYDTAHGFEHTDTVWQFYLDDELINGAAVTVVAEDGDGRTATWSGIMAAGGEFEGYMRSDD